ncbi:hypothetical protein MA16_Dca015283 [Dendrobium catenatum]|uniref:Uncharacterized protein n=1 Tax=Dendrobium catenatum TaxID=906689 RepID=A0A2I0X012_9ASPA|nr:hypothetical protein MA16_Dca015283 [Dendrobium catenatum]
MSLIFPISFVQIYMAENIAVDNYSVAMAQGQKHPNLWEFRKQDDPDSSDEECQSSSSAEERLKQISDLVATKTRRATDINHQHLFMNRPVKKDNRTQFLNQAMKVDRNYGRKMKRQCKESKVKSNNGDPEPATISSNLILMQSILEELRVRREHLLEWMRTEVRKLVDDGGK